MPLSLFADDLSGRIELNYTDASTTTEDAAGISTETKSDSFSHLYGLNLQRAIYPNLTLFAGGLFSQTISNDHTDDTDFKSTTTTKSGFLDLSLGTRYITSGLGYNRLEDKVDIRDSTSFTGVRENYTANLGLRPEGLPEVNIRLLRTYNYDKDRAFQDDVTDNLSLGLKYEPYRGLDLRYQTELSILTDRLSDHEVNRTAHNALGTYTRNFGKRVFMRTSYNYGHQETRTTTGGSGEVLFQIFPFSGLSAVADTPSLVTLDQNPALIDGIFASAGINIGKTSIGEDTSKRNIGVDFINVSEVNKIFLWVDRDLPDAVIKAFSWDIYTSSDNLNWTKVQTVSPALFGTFDNRFEINFNNVKTRYLKVVTSPLSPAIFVPSGFDVSNILVTELQTFIRKSADEVEDKTSSTSHLYDLNVKWNILDRPTLFYDFYYSNSILQPADISRYIITNALNLRHRFSSILSGAARIAREDGKETTGGETTDKRSANAYSASLTATPLPTLMHNLTVSGRFEKTETGSVSSHSVFLNNRAALYRGLDFLLSGGASVSYSETDRRNLNTVFNSGLTAVPHPKVEIGLIYSETHSKQTGGDLEDNSDFSKSGQASISYLPFDTMYIFASYRVIARKDRNTNTLQSYEATWSPFPDGDLQFNVSYFETLNSETDGKTRTITPSLRWRLMRNTYLNVAYSVLTDKSVIQDSETKTFTSTLSMTL